MTNDGNNNDTNVRTLDSASTVQQKRQSMIRLLSDVLAEVASGQTLGVVVMTYSGQRAYQIKWSGDYDPMQLAGAIEVTKLQVLGPMLQAGPPTPIKD
jgi:hypothetical protein